ncbi:MAG: AsmA-like C-terminal region-containing protein, partial [Opitutus sp.]
QTTVFVFGESDSPTIRGTPLDYARTIMFIRPTFFDALEFFATRGPGDVRGTFERHLHPDSRDWTKMIFDIESTVDLVTGAGLLGPEIATMLEPFSFSRAPHVKAIGQLDGPASARGEHQSLQLSTQSSGKFSVYKFPAENLSFEATLEDDKLSLERIEAKVASGLFTGRARLWGPEEQRRIAFNATLHGGLLSEAVTVVSDYAAQRSGQGIPAGDKFMPGKSQIKMDLALSAEGKFDDLLSYEGTGNAVLTGAELGEVRLLGLLSELLDFTALRFTTARLNFQVQGAKVTFPTANVTGANSAIEGHGEYALDRGEIDFNARVYPFKESTSILGSMVGVVLLPLSTALEVRLTGPLRQPKWAFLIGPTNFIRSLTSPSKTSTEKPPDAPPTSSVK